MYNGVEVPNFVKVTGIDQYLLPEIEQYNSKIPSSYGNIDGGISYGSKVFTVHYMIIFDGEHNDSYYVGGKVVSAYALSYIISFASV